MVNVVETGGGGGGVTGGGGGGGGFLPFAPAAATLASLEVSIAYVCEI
jgi:hypothetical protein